MRHLTACKITFSLAFLNWIKNETAPYMVERCLRSLVFSPDEVKLTFQYLPTGKATGPDGLSNRILSVPADELSIPACALFNQSLQHGTVPDCFKETHVCQYSRW